MLTRLVQKFLDMLKSPIYIVVAAASLFLVSNPVFASENIDYNVSVASSLTLTIPTSSIVLNLDPSSKTFDSEDLTVSVGTNNKTGYTLTLSTPNNNTDLNRDSSSDSIVAKIETLASGTYTESTFTPDKWGYSINSNTAIPSTITSGYVPFVSGNTLMESSTAVNKDETELTFAAKIDYLQPAGSYATQLNFNLVANPLVSYIQDFTIDMCRTLASSGDYTVVDKRDNNDYTVRYINGNCWMTQNLRFIGDATYDSSDRISGTMTLNSTTSNVESTYTASNPLVINYLDSLTGDSTTDPKIHNSKNTTNGVWYNYAAATAGQIAGSTTAEATRSICPAGWRLASHSEQSNIISYVSIFNVVVGGAYIASGPSDPTHGYYQSSTVGSSGVRRYILHATTSSMTAPDTGSTAGSYVRCIANDGRDLNDSTVVNMQDINKQIVANTANGATKTLIDSRDGQEYTVAKINGNLWMTRNLAIGCNGTGSTYGSAMVTGGKALTPANTNITSNWTTPTDSLTLGLTLGDSYDDPRMECSSTYGAWYNYATVSAGTIIGSSNSTAATSDICPAGWHLPNHSEMSSISSGYATDFNADSSGGMYQGGQQTGFGMVMYWSSDAYNANLRRTLDYRTGANINPNNAGYRYYGEYTRCIAN